MWWTFIITWTISKRSNNQEEFIRKISLNNNDNIKNTNSRTYSLKHVIIKIMKSLLLLSLLVFAFAEYQYDGDVMVLTEETFD